MNREGSFKGCTFSRPQTLKNLKSLLGEISLPHNIKALIFYKIAAIISLMKNSLKIKVFVMFMALLGVVWFMKKMKSEGINPAVFQMPENGFREDFELFCLGPVVEYKSPQLGHLKLKPTGWSHNGNSVSNDKSITQIIEELCSIRLSGEIAPNSLQRKEEWVDYGEFVFSNQKFVKLFFDDRGLIKRNGRIFHSSEVQRKIIALIELVNKKSPN